MDLNRNQEVQLRVAAHQFEDQHITIIDDISRSQSRDLPVKKKKNSMRTSDVNCKDLIIQMEDVNDTNVDNHTILVPDTQDAIVTPAQDKKKKKGRPKSNKTATAHTHKLSQNSSGIGAVPKQTDRYFIDRKKVNPDLFVIEIEICTCIYNIVNLLKSYDNIHSMTYITKIMLAGIAIRTLGIYLK